MRFCLLLAVLACSKKPEPEYGSVCHAEAYYLAEDASGRPLDIADARGGARVTGFLVWNPEYLKFRPGGRIRVEFDVWDVSWIEELEYAPGSPKAKILDLVDGGVIGAHPIRVEGSPPKFVTLGFSSDICTPGAVPQTCTELTKQKSVFATYTCTEKQL